MIRYAISSSKWLKTLRNEQSRIISCSNHFKNKNAENTKKSTNLHEILYKNIKVNGPMSVASFMKEALTNKNYVSLYVFILSFNLELKNVFNSFHNSYNSIKYFFPT